MPKKINKTLFLTTFLLSLILWIPNYSNKLNIFGKSFENISNSNNSLNARTSRSLRGETHVKKSNRRTYAKNIYSDDDNSSFDKPLNELKHDISFRNKHNSGRQYKNSEGKLDSLNDYNNFRNGVDKFNYDNDDDYYYNSSYAPKKYRNELKNTSNSFYYDDAYERNAQRNSFYHDGKDVSNDYEKSHETKESYRNLKISNKKKKNNKENKKSFGSIKNDHYNELGYVSNEQESLEAMVALASSQEKPKSGFKELLKKYDQMFDVECLRAIKSKAISESSDFKYKNAKGKLSLITRRLMIYTPPLVNLLFIILLLMITQNAQAFSFFSMIFLILMTYYGYKFSKAKKITKTFQNFISKYKFDVKAEF
ncbi:Plasmodium exported protein, unknown function [Plasmodium gonderi]|uniref:Pv-fam-d protein n=1 Tax=Plasmodium gonderi TaxID=77519 RepID=A0A1Y1JQ31_PLAGO|nr:Plasmodium exported protein, unknown function [Plasmodium gonderi]GAW84320.1 Plasmodium exported protein, unknown function [Plasmodium gonderi]